MVKRWVGTLMAVVTVLALATTGVWAQPTKITFWHIWDAGSTQGAVIEDLINRFNEMHKGSIEVESVLTDFWTFEEKFRLAVAGGIPPDIIHHDLVTTKRRAYEDLIINMLPYMERDGIDPSEFWPSAIEAASYQGGIYSLPFSIDTRVFFYNIDHFAESGLDPNQPPETWEDLEWMGPRLTRATADGDLERVGFHPMWGNGWFLPWAWTNGGDWFTADGVPTIDRAENVEALEWAVSWIQRYGKGFLDEFSLKFSQGEPFTVGLVSTILETNGYAERAEKNNPDLNFGVVKVPYNRVEASWSAGFDLEIVKTPAGNYDAAWEFVKFMTSEEVAREWDFKLKDMGSRPIAAAQAYPDDPNWINMVNQMLTSRPTPFSFEVFDWWQITYPRIESAVNLEVAPLAALTQAQEEVMARYREAVGN